MEVESFPANGQSIMVDVSSSLARRSRDIQLANQSGNPADASIKEASDDYVIQPNKHHVISPSSMPFHLQRQT